MRSSCAKLGSSRHHLLCSGRLSRSGQERYCLSVNVHCLRTKPKWVPESASSSRRRGQGCVDRQRNSEYSLEKKHTHKNCSLNIPCGPELYIYQRLAGCVMNGPHARHEALLQHSLACDLSKIHTHPTNCALLYPLTASLLRCINHVVVFRST